VRDDWQAVIGLETHVELQTRSKMFCGCAVTFGAEPNTTCCPVCLGLPGALPVPNEEAIEGILRIGAALGCTLVEYSEFHRKNYFYPDLPKNYQISQFDLPICIEGTLDVGGDAGQSTTIGITRVHMEEDTGKSRHLAADGRIQDAAFSLIDFNRAGVPLVEVVSEPDIRSADEARAYAVELQRVVRVLGVSDARLEEGSMRFDANVSLRPVGAEELGTRSEVKNVNSLRSLHDAIGFEIDRQMAVLESGGTIVQETRHWHEDRRQTIGMRSKEESEDYRYFQEPDLVPIVVDDAWRAEVVRSLPELPAARRRRYLEAGLELRTADNIGDEAAFSAMFDEALAAGGEPKAMANWLTGEVVAYLRREDTQLAATGLTARHLVDLVAMVERSEVSASAAKDVLHGVLAGEGSPASVADSRDLRQISDDSAVRGAVDEVLAENGEALERMRAGDMKPIGFLVGQVMKATGGKADPKLVSELIHKAVEPG
jgi:aspartyl-tRNA(Asn)/glutamyl-tRNA(Gln) amidotransferase subunit B